MANTKIHLYAITLAVATWVWPLMSAFIIYSNFGVEPENFELETVEKTSYWVTIVYFCLVAAGGSFSLYALVRHHKVKLVLWLSLISLILILVSVVFFGNIYTSFFQVRG